MTASVSPKIATNKLWWVGLLAGVVAAAANLVVFFVANASGANLQIPATPGSSTLGALPVGAVIAASIIPAIAATVLLAILGRFTANPFRIFLIVAGVFLLLSFGGPMSLPVVASTKVVLNLMHLVAGAAIVGVLWALGRNR